MILFNFADLWENQKMLTSLNKLYSGQRALSYSLRTALLAMRVSLLPIEFSLWRLCLVIQCFRPLTKIEEISYSAARHLWVHVHVPCSAEICCTFYQAWFRLKKQTLTLSCISMATLMISAFHKSATHYRWPHKKTPIVSQYIYFRKNRLFMIFKSFISFIDHSDSERKKG